MKYPGEPLKTLAALVFQVGNHNGLVLVVLYNEVFPAAAWNGDNNSRSIFYPLPVTARTMLGSSQQNIFILNFSRN